MTEEAYRHKKTPTERLETLGNVNFTVYVCQHTRRITFHHNGSSNKRLTVIGRQHNAVYRIHFSLFGRTFCCNGNKLLSIVYSSFLPEAQYQNFPDILILDGTAIRIWLHIIIRKGFITRILLNCLNTEDNSSSFLNSTVKVSSHLPELPHRTEDKIEKKKRK